MSTKQWQIFNKEALTHVFVVILILNQHSCTQTSVDRSLIFSFCSLNLKKKWSAGIQEKQCVTETYCPGNSVCKDSNNSFFGVCYSLCELTESCPPEKVCVQHYVQDILQCERFVLTFLLDVNVSRFLLHHNKKISV